MLVLVNYVFDRENLEQWCKDEWLKVYDTKFVTELIEGVLRWQPHIADMVKRWGCLSFCECTCWISFQYQDEV
jgi:hypothetical protein